jgi:CheY-like chemotaxis protein
VVRSLFRIILPNYFQSAACRFSADGIKGCIELVNTRLKILVAEDNPDDIFFLQQALKKAGVECILNSACDGLQTMAYLKGEDAFSDRVANPFPDILLLDLNMPGMNGFEVLEAVRKDSRCSRLIVHVMSASSRELDIDKAYELGANSYVVKPSRIDELVRFISALDQWHRFVALPRCG